MDVPASRATGATTATGTTRAAAAPAAVGFAAGALRTLTLAALGALIVLGLAWELWLAPTGRGALALKVLPLALVLPGLWRQRLHTFRVLSLLVWLYVLEGLVRATSEGGIAVVLAALEVALAIVLFTVATLSIRRGLRAAASAGPQAATGHAGRATSS